MRKKLMALVLSAVLVCTGLAGCGGSTASDEGGKNAEGKTELVLWMTYSDDSFDGLDAIVTKFNESSDKYHLTMEYGGTVTEVSQKLNTLDKKDYPSLFTGSPDMLCEYATADFVKPLQGFLDKDSDDWETDIIDVAKRTYTDKDGNMVGGILGISAKGWMVNTTMLAEAGYAVEDITSMEKVAEISKAAHDKGLCQYGYTPYSGSEIVDILTYQGVDILDKGNGYDGTSTKSMYTEGETGEALKKLANLYADMGKNGSFYYGAGGASGVSLFTNKQMLFWGCTNSFVYTLSDMTLDFEWAFVPYVGVDSNAKYQNCALAEGTGLFIANTENEAEMQGAYEIIKFFAEAENQLSWCTYRGYVPFTNEAASSETWTTWMNEEFPSAQKLIEQLQNTPEDIKLPYTSLGKNIMDNSGKLHSKIFSDASGDVDKYISDITKEINQAIELLKLRGE